jgi:hypothetical protein
VKATILLAWAILNFYFGSSGMAIASNLKGEFNKHHIAIIGDASILQVWLLKVKSRGSY